MDADKLEFLVNKVIAELAAAGLIRQPPAEGGAPGPARPPSPPGELSIDLPDPTTAVARRQAGVTRAANPEGLAALLETTPARIGAGRSGERLRTPALLLFQSDLAVTQDALLCDVDPKLLDELKLCRVQTRITGGKQEYLLRPDLGRQLSDEARRTISERGTKQADVQLCVGDGLSAAAIEANLRKIIPVIEDGCKTAGLSLGMAFYIQYCRVGVMNEIGDLLQPKVVILLIGERPGLGRAESMSAYMAYRPKTGDTDAERDVICNIYDGGGANPLEAGAYAVQLAQKMIQKQASGVKLKLMEK
jgi:ethanolamine ammonia-lyase small subunit